MSIINNVLKELENRSSRFTPIEIASVDNSVGDRGHFTNSYAIILFILLLVSALTMAMFQTWSNPFASLAQPRQSVADFEQPRPLPGADAVVAVNQIIGLQINESEHELKLEFLLREKVIAYLKERSEDSFIYHLKGIQSEIVAPVIDDERWLEQLSIEKSSKGIDIQFRTAPGILVETRQELVANEPLWRITLKKMPDSAAAPENSSEAAQTALLAPIAENKAGLSPAAPAEKKAALEHEPAPAAKLVKLNITSSRGRIDRSDQLKQIDQLLKSRQWSVAEARLVELISGPQDLEARKLLSSVYQQQRRPEQFSSLARDSIRIYPQQAWFRTEYAKSLYRMQAYQAVIDLVRQSPDEDAKQNALIAASLQRLDRHEEAVKYYKKSLAIDERQSRNWIGLGISQEHTGDPRSALNSYAIALKLGKLNQKLLAFVGNRSRLLEKALN